VNEADPRRLLDANANRAREAARTIEDAARFLLDDAALAEAGKRLRHDLGDALRGLEARLGGERLSLWRDTPGDVGTSITTDAEGRRVGAGDVVAAAGKRLSEAIRALEEYGKLASPEAGAWFEAIRYRGYELETRVTARLARPDPRRWRVCVLLSESLCESRDWLATAAAAAEGGADCLQLREKRLDDVELLGRARRLVEMRDRLAAAARPAIVVNDRPDIARLAGADGVHLGQGDLPPGAVRRLVGRSLLLGLSTHNLDEARAAVEADADYCGVGAMFPTATKPRDASGPGYLRAFVEAYPDRAHLAIGGVTLDNVDQLVEAGARAVAVSRAVCAAADPARAVASLIDKLPPPGPSPTERSD